MRTSHLFVQVAALAGTLLSMTNAQAASVTYPGDMCIANGGGAYSLWYGTVDNQSSSSALNLVCAAPRHGSAITSAAVRVYNRNSTGFITCTLYDMFVTSSGIYGYANTQSITAWGASYLTLSYGAISSSTTGTDWYDLECSLPVSQNGNVSHIINYTINES